MALDFPANPENGDTYNNFYWDESAGIWRRVLTVTNLSDLDSKPINDLDDVSISSPSDGDILQYDGENWSNTFFPVNEDSPLSGEFLKYDGSNWISQIISTEDIEEFDLGTPVTNTVIYYDGNSWISGIPPLIETSAKNSSYTLQLEDVGKMVRMNAGSGAEVTIPNSSTINFPVGSVVGIYNTSSEDVEIVGASGVTVRNAGPVGQYLEASVRKRADNEWVMVGG